MNNVSNFSVSLKWTSLSLFLMSLFFVPFFAFASTKTSADATIDVSSLTSNLSKPTITGTATGTKSIKISIYKEGSKKIVYKKSSIKVREGIWKSKISKKLRNGTYTITISGTSNTTPKILATEILVIDTNKKKNTVSEHNALVISSIPLLAGGNARPGTSVPVSYLQVNNIGEDAVTLKGFRVKQNGSAPTQSIIGFSVVDDQGITRGSIGGTEGTILFKDTFAFIPIKDMLFTQKEMRLFTIKATLGKNISQYIGKQLMIDIASVETSTSPRGNFPIRGTTWTIIN